MKRVYLDHAATTPVDKRVVAAMLPYFGEKFGNASSIHSFGRETRKAVEESREIIAGFIGASANEVFFTSGGTEADNLAIKGAVFAGKSKGERVITSAVEHHAVLNTCKWLGKNGWEVIYLPVDEFGIISVEKLKEAIDGNTVLISVMAANNETGSLQPISEIGKIARDKGVLFHTDAVQAVGKIPVDVKKLNVDLLSVSAHKIYGPKGIGTLYIRKGTKIEKLLHGGHHERNRRAGTENVPAIVGFAKAVEIAKSGMEEENKKLLKLRDKLEKTILSVIENVRVNGHPEKRLPNTSNISFEFVEGESIILSLDMKGVAVASGSACTSGSLEPSHVLSAMGVPPEIAQGSIRFSMGKDNTEEDVDFVARELKGIVSHLREMSPLYPGKK